MRTMKARKRSDCPGCGSTIKPGERIVKPTGARYWTCCGSDSQPRYGITQSGYRAYRSNGMCEDAPCCGCCGPNVYDRGY